MFILLITLLFSFLVMERVSALTVGGSARSGLVSWRTQMTTMLSVTALTRSIGVQAVTGFYFLTPAPTTLGAAPWQYNQPLVPPMLQPLPLPKPAPAPVLAFLKGHVPVPPANPAPNTSQG